MELTDEQIQQITDKVTESLTASDAFGKSIGESVRRIVPGILEANLKDVTKSVEDLKKALKADPPNPDDPPKGGKKKDGEPDPEFLKLQRESEEQKQALERLESERATEKKQADALRRRTGFLEAATELGMRGVDFVHSRFQDRLGETDDGQVVIEVSREAAGQTYTEKVPVKEWLGKEFLTSDEGKPFVPARAAGGSGGRQGQEGSGGSGGQPSRDQLVDQVFSDLPVG